MMMFFRRKRKINDYEKTMEKLDQRLEQLEETIQQLAKQGLTYHISIEKLDIHDPVLENLTFKFDQLDVNEVSGALNLGNNFGVRVDQDKHKSQMDKKKQNTHSSEPMKDVRNKSQSEDPGKEDFDEKVKMKRKEKGYSFRFKS